LPRLAVTVLVLALLAATTTAFALTEVLKLERTPIVPPGFKVAFSPECECSKQTARFRIRLRSDETVDATIVDSDGHAVRTLLRDSRRPAGTLRLRWDGRSDAGAVVSDGTYKLLLDFVGSDRSILLPNPIRVDSRPPRAELLTFSPRAISGEEAVEVIADSDEAARLLLLEDGKRVARGRLGEAGEIDLHWRSAAALGPGPHLLSVVVRDRAGNSAPVSGGQVELVVK